MLSMREWDGDGAIFHIAERGCWEAARAAGGVYEMSTRGRTLGEVGFVHACRSMGQVEGVLGRFYGDVDDGDLVLLVIDPARLGVPVRHEMADGERYPHIYGPVPLDAVIEVRSVSRRR